MYIESKKVLMIGLAVMVSAVFGMWVFSPTKVVVTGTGKVSVPATSATFNVTVSATNDSANGALTDLRTKVNAVKKTLGDINIGADNITETQVTLTPAAAVVASAKGFQAMSTLTVKTANVAMASEIVVNMYASGATIVSQPVVSVENQDKLEQQALKDALTDARANLSDTVGFRPIRKIIGIEQASSGNVATTTKSAAEGSGEFEVVKAVSVTYRVW
jgi:uncharacterized protein YggE